MYLLFVLTLLQLQDKANSQKWITPTDRVVYGVNGTNISLIWKLDREGKSINLAEWQLIEDGKPKTSIVLSDSKGEVTLADGVNFPTFGEVVIGTLNTGIHKRIKTNIEFIGGHILTDLVTIQYVSGTPEFTSQKLQPAYNFSEGDLSGKNVVMEMSSKGNPAPSILWTLDGQNVSTIPGFTVTETTISDGDEFLITSKLTIAELTGDNNGELSIISKFGGPEITSPQSEVTRLIDIKFAPRNLNFTHNITNNLIIEEGDIHFYCEAKGNPKPTYTLKEGTEVVKTGPSLDEVIYINKYHHSRKLHYICVASNSLGSVHSEVEEIRLNGVLTAKRYAPEDDSWWIYFGVACAIALVLFVGLFFTLRVVRRRMRSLNLKDDTRHIGRRDNGPNHVYDLNERGRQGTADRLDTASRTLHPNPNKLTPNDQQIATDNVYDNSGYDNGLSEVGQQNP